MVLENLRSLSKMEFYKMALRIRTILTVWALKDFGTKKNTHSLQVYVKTLSEEDKRLVDEILNKYNISPNHQVLIEAPQRFIEREQGRLDMLLAELMDHIVEANTNHNNRPVEAKARRMAQDMAIATCFKIFHEIYHIMAVLKLDLNKLADVIAMLDREITLLRGWRKSDNDKGVS